jgi:molybdenum cofactor synthesis domain-containing protein
MTEADAPVTAALLVVGEEILSGRTRDRNIGTTADFCTEHGIELREVRVVGDTTEAIVTAVRALSRAYSYVFTTGGIGPTHDDITADAVAEAFGVDLPVNEIARQILEDRYGSVDVSPARLRMARIPAGADLIANSVSGAPGFRIGNVHVMAGVPKIMEAMLEAIGPTLKGGRKLISHTIDVGVGESIIAEGLSGIQAEYPDVRIGSYPQMGRLPIYTQLVLRGADANRLNEATQWVQALVDRVHKEKGVELPKETR